MRYCTRCARRQSGNDRFCTECGTPFGPPADQWPAQPAQPGQPAQPPGAGPAARQDPPADWAVQGYAGAGQGYGGPAEGYGGAGQGYGGAGQGGVPASGEPESWGPAGDPLDSLFRPYPAGPDDTGAIPAPPDYGPGGIEFGPPQRQRPGSASRRILVALAVLILLAAGGTGAWLGLRHSPTAASAGSSAPQHTTAPPPASTTPATTPSVTPTASPTSSARSGLVAVLPGVTRTGAEPQVVAFLNTYFTAINSHDYQRYSALLGPRVRRTETAPVFRSGYRSTTDSAVTLTGISATGAGQVAAGVTFISHQAAADSPSHSRCTDWNILLVLGKQHGMLLLQPPPSGYHASFRRC